MNNYKFNIFFGLSSMGNFLDGAKSMIRLKPTLGTLILTKVRHGKPNFLDRSAKPRENDPLILFLIVHQWITFTFHPFFSMLQLSPCLLDGHILPNVYLSLTIEPSSTPSTSFSISIYSFSLIRFISLPSLIL